MPDQNPIVAELIDKTYRELAEHAKPQARSRISDTPNGYIHLVAWSNASLLRTIIRKFTDTLPKSEYRTKTQIDDAARSSVANIEEGFARPTTKEYLNFLGFSQASLIEVKGDIQRLRQDNLLPSRPGSSLGDLGIDLGDWHEALKASVISRPPPGPASSKVPQNPLDSSKGLYRNLEDSRGKSKSVFPDPLLQTPHPLLQIPLKSYKFLYSPVDNLDPHALTYEIFIELVNKTDWHLRKLVIALEDKLARDQKYYQVEQARIRGKVSWSR